MRVGKGRVGVIVWLLGVQTDHVLPAPHEPVPLLHDLLLGDHAETARLLYIIRPMKLFGGMGILKSLRETAWTCAR